MLTKIIILYTLNFTLLFVNFVSAKLEEKNQSKQIEI